MKTPGLHAVGGVAGLALQIGPNGSKSWILRAMIGGRRREMGLGAYPGVGVAAARKAAQEARDKVRHGVDPVDDAARLQSALAARKATEVTFRQAAEKYISKQESGWSRKSHFQWSTSLEAHAYPVIGSIMVRDIGLPQVLAVLEPLWNSKTETASRLRGRIEKILDWATVSKLRTGENPARWKGNLEMILPARHKVQVKQHFAALPYRELATFMKRLRLAEGQGARALEFTILTVARSDQTRGATWQEFNVAERMWVIPGSRMKGGREHRVPLSKSVLELLKHQDRVEGIDLVFPTVNNKKMSDATMSAVLKRMRLDVTVHGFRSTFADWRAELTNYPGELAEMALAHRISDKVEEAYRRGDLFDKRRQLMNDWARFCVGSASQRRGLRAGKPH